MFEAVGGLPFFDALVERFYAAVADDPLLRPLYPDDLTGPNTTSPASSPSTGAGRQYSDDRGHPRLRMRHVPFAIGQAERDAWLGHMTGAWTAWSKSAICRRLEARMIDYFTAADHMMNDSAARPSRP